MRTIALCSLAVVGVLFLLQWSGSDVASAMGGRHLSDVEAIEEEVSSMAAGGGKCSLADRAAMNRLGGGHSQGSFPQTLSSCGNSAYSWFSFHKDQMKSCLESNAHLSGSCADCFVDAGQYSFNNCKAQCLFGSWCSNWCLSCARGSDAQVQRCAGVDVPQVTEC